MSQLPTVCVIGAGSLRHRRRQGPARARRSTFDCFEKSDRVGGNWVFGNTQRDVVRVPLAAHQHVARADGVLGLPDAEVLSRLPAPHAHRRVLRRLRRPLRLPRPDPLRDRRRARRRARPTAPGRSRSTDGDDARATTRCSSPTATTGTRAGPSRRSPARRFDGRADALARLHGRRPDELPRQARRRARDGQLGDGHRGRGVATSPSDVYLAARRGAHVIPKYLFGKPLDQISAARRAASRSRSGAGARRAAASVARRRHGALRAARSPTTASARPTRRSPDDILARIAHGDDHAEAEHRAARRATRCASPTAREVEADVVVYCTGYKVTFPFFDEGFISAPDNDLPLFRRVFHPDIGERVLRRAAAAARRDHAARRGAVASGSRDYLAGRVRAAAAGASCAPTSRPSARAMFKRYVASKRHTMQVDFDDYLFELRRSAGGAPSARGPGLPAAGAGARRRRDGDAGAA